MRMEVRALRWLVLTLLIASAAHGQSGAPTRSGEVEWKAVTPAPITQPISATTQPMTVQPVSAMPPAAAVPGQPVRLLPDERPALPINLAMAMQLASARPLDVQMAARQVQIAVAQFDRAKVLWAPSVLLGADYFYHNGGVQDVSNALFNDAHSSLLLGGGYTAIFGISDAIFSPLAARQDLSARQAQARAVGNDMALAVAEAYFGVQQARGELAGALAYVKQAEELVRRTSQLAEGLAPAMEASRARVELARRQQTVAALRERWQVASAELIRLLRLDASAVVEPMEPANLTIQLLEPNYSLDDLVAIGLTARPELSAHRAFVQATLQRLRQEKLRPLVPSVLLRGASTNPGGTLAYGAFGGGVNGAIGALQGRGDYDVQVLWELQNFGLGNKARIDERRAEREVALLQLFKMQDIIAAEIVMAHSQWKAASERLAYAEPALKDALDTLQKNMDGLAQTRRVGNVLILVARPQEVVAALQALAQANTDYFAAVADFNRAQFRLYRATGQPAQCLTNLPAK
jgi:outer membrane protein TolC